MPITVLKIPLTFTRSSVRVCEEDLTVHVYNTILYIVQHYTVHVYNSILYMRTKIYCTCVQHYTAHGCLRQ